MIWGKYDNTYSASDTGLIRNDKSKKILKPRKNSCGYLKVNINNKEVLVHNVVMQAFNGIRPQGLVINHKDGKKHNNSLDNLEYCTQSENLLHYYRVIKPLRSCYAR